MSYFNEDGKPDDLNSVLTLSRCMGVAIGHLLEPSEGIVVELVQQPNHPDEVFGKFIIWNDAAAGKIRLGTVEPGSEEDSCDNGQMLWVNKGELH